MQPIVIGGVGGSGTRVVAAAVRASGIAIGRDLNKANDNLSFDMMANRPAWWARHASRGNGRIERMVQLFYEATTSSRRSPRLAAELIGAVLGHSLHTRKWRRVRARRLWNSMPIPDPWGWKSPISHMYLPQLDKVLGVRYIHVIRSGTDMAKSRNQNQVHYWGTTLVEDVSQGPAEHQAFRYWYAANRRAIEWGREMGSKRFLLVRFEDLCSSPAVAMKRIVDFVGSSTPLDDLVSLVRPPRSLGRGAQLEARLGPKERAMAAELGYPS